MLKCAFRGQQGLEEINLQFLGSKKTVDGYFYKMSDSLFATYNIVGHGTELNRRLNMLEPFSIIKIVECYKQGFCIVIVEFEVCDERPGFLLNNKNDKIEYITREFIMNIASNKGGLNSDGSPNEASMFFSEKVLLTPRQLGRKTKN